MKLNIHDTHTALKNKRTRWDYDLSELIMTQYLNVILICRR